MIVVYCHQFAGEIIIDYTLSITFQDNAESR